MNKRTRIRQRIAAVISTLLILQMMMPAELVNAAAIPDTSEAYLAETITDVSDEAGITIDEGTGDESASEGLPAEELTEDPVLEEGLLDDQDDLSELEELSDTVEEGLTEEEVSENALLSENEAETTEPAENAAAKAKMTVMLYSLGSDLEGKSMSATVDILEIMEGIYLAGTDSKNVNFVVETGGVDTGIRNRAKIIADRRAELTERYANDIPKQKRYLARYDLLTKEGEDTDPISWGVNERYLITADELEAVQKQPTEPSRLMTYEDNNKVIPELAEFIKTTKADYPADQYMLILWNHGGGPIGGLGPDDRDRRKENKLTIQAWNIAPTMKEAGVTENTKFAYVNYDACLMGNLENALAWSPYANYYCGSEDLEPNDGDFYENWVSYLCKEAADPSKDFKKQEYVNSLVETIGRRNVDDFYAWYSDKGDIGTKSLIKLSKINNVSKALSDYSDKINKLFTLDPIETYYSLEINRNLTQDFSGRDMGIMDLGCFVKQIKSEFLENLAFEAQERTDIKNAVKELNKSGENLLKNMNEAVIHHKETEKYTQFDLHGLTTYMPYMSLSRNDIEKYLSNYRSIAPTSESLKNYRKFVGTFCSIQDAGKMAADSNKGLNDIRAEFTRALDQYDLLDIYKDRMQRVPDEIDEHRIQREALKICKDETGSKYYYKRRDDKFVSAVLQAPYFIKKNDPDQWFNFLGYLPAGGASEEEKDGINKQELINYADKYWFGFKGADNKYIPVTIEDVNSGFVDDKKTIHGNPFTAKTDILIPILFDGGLNMLDVGFEENQAEGKIYGMYPFEYDNRGYGRYIDINSLVSGNNVIEIGLLFDMSNVLAGENGVVFDKGHPDRSLIAKVNINANTKLYRNIKLFDKNNISSSANIEKMEMRYVIRDVFNCIYNFEESKPQKIEKDYQEEVDVEPETEMTRRPKNSQLKSSDLRLRFTGKTNQEVYEDSQLTDLKYYFKDKNGNKVDLLEYGGRFYYKPNNQENLVPYTISDKTVIYVDTANAKMKKIDGATEGLDKYFKLQTGNLKFNFDVITAPDPTTSSNKQYTSKSKAYAKRAIPNEIADVTYTGRPLLTTQSTGNGSKVIDLVIYSEDGDSMLREGIDYTVSYRNNKNVGKMTDKNPPTLTINGKGDYAGMKYIARFNILKADMKDVELTFNKHFVPLNKKGISLGITATLPSGVKIPANQIAYEYYGLSGNKISVSDFQKAYAAGTEMMPFTVKAVARSNAKNLTGKTGSYPSNDELYAYPKNKGSLKVVLSSNKVRYSDDWSGYDFLNENFKKASLGKTVVNLEDLEFWGVYYDTKFTRQVYDDMLTTAGTCYIAVSLTPEKQKQYHNYQVVALRISVSGGTGLKKGNVTLKESVYTLRLDTMTLLNPITLQTDYVTLNFNDSLKMDDFTRLTLTCSTRQGGAVVKTITRADIKDKKLVLNDIDNHAPGTYTIQIKSVGKNTGSLKLTYKVRR